MRAPGVVIVGTGRSGSGYIAQLLCEMGVPCGHEGWFNPWGEHADGLAADSSWCALALGLGGYRGTVLHQLRHPLDVVSSLVEVPLHGEYAALAERVLRRWLLAPEGDVETAAALVVVLGRLAEGRAAWSWRVEDVAAPLLIRIAAECVLAVGSAAVAAALDAVPHDWNRHHDAARLDWADVPAGPIRDALIGDAERWGYE